jgi:hypothetical protein
VSTYNATGLVYDQSNLTFDGNPAGLSNLPVVGVFVAFDDGPYVADPDWVEVTDYVRDVSIRRGRQDDLQQFPSGSCSITFDNRDRLFDPFNTAGTYYGKLKPRRQVRVVGQWNGVNYPLFRGFVAGWPVEFTDGGKDSTVTIDCFDLLGLLANENVPADWAEFVTRDTTIGTTTGPYRYWRCNDSQSTQVVKDQNNVRTPINLAQIGGAGYLEKCFEVDSLAKGIYSNAMYLPFRFETTNISAPTTPTDITVLAWMEVPEVRATSNNWLRYYYGSTKIDFLADGTNPYILDVSNGTTNIRVRPPFINRNQPTHVAISVVINAGGTPTVNVYYNSELQVVTSTTSAVSTANVEYARVENLALSEFTVFLGALSATQIKSIYDAGSGRVPDTTTARMNRVINTTEVPVELRSFAAVPAATVSEINTQQGVIPELERVTRSENGELFVAADGVLVFRNRGGWASSSRSNTSQVTFTDTGTGVYYDAGSLRMSLDADKMRNVVDVSFTGGGTVTVVDQDSVDEFGAGSDSVSTILDDASAAVTLGEYRVSLFKTPKLGVEPFLVKGQRNPSYDWPRLLNLELLDRFTFVRTPSVGSAIQKDMLLQSVEHRITPGTWETTINGSARYTGWFILGVSLLGSTEDVLL